MKLSDIKTLITSGTIILAVALYMIFSDPKEDTEPTTPDVKVSEQQSAEQESKEYVITPELAMDVHIAC